MNEELSRLIDEAARRILAGGVVAYPTETCYGLAARADDMTAVERVRVLKGRDERPVSVLVADASWLDRLALPLNDAERRLVAAFWPGPLTLCLRPLQETATARLAAPLLGVRCSSHPVAIELARRAGVPLTSTSANLTGQPVTASEAEVRRVFAGEDVLVLSDPTPRDTPAESTVVAIIDDALKIFREGVIPAAEIRRALADLLPPP
ncbi:MAG: threonylcarbamoyl-AMP synthase [Myxococcales bacterium]|nr:MAG: threonylcarbamoyl-AMP synthase [Myxococcales bacterium]